MASKIYSGAATVGRVYSWVGAIVGTLFGLGMIAVGIFLRRQESSRSGSETATVVSSSCSSINNQKDCTASITFPSCKTGASVDTGSSEKIKGQKIPVIFNPKDACNTVQGKSTKNTASIVSIAFIGFGIVAILGGWLHVYLTMKYKPVAAVSGAADTVGLIARAL